MTEPTSPSLMHGLANALADAMQHRDAHNQYMGKDDRHSERLDFMEKLEAESVDAVKEMMGGLLNTPGIPDESREMIRQMVEPDHPVQLAALIPILAALGWKIADGLLAGPVSRLQTLSLRNFGDIKPDPMYAADAAARMRIPNELAEAWADDNGFTEVNFGLMIDAARQTLAPTVALALWQQGKIGQARFVEILGRNGFEGAAIEEWQRLQFRPPDAAAALNAVTQSQITAEHAMRLLAENGIDPSNYEWLYETNGQSPGIEVLNRLKNYGLIDDGLYEAGILESPIKNKYVEPLKNSRFRRPPMEQTLSMVRRRAITPEKGLEYLAFNGYFPDDAQSLVDWALTAQDDETKSLTAANIRAMYSEGLIDRATTSARLTELGYPAEDVDMMLNYADSVRLRQRITTSLSHIRSQYMAWKIDLPTAANAIDRLGVPSPRRDELLNDWQIAHEASQKHLTNSEMFRMLKAELLTSDEVFNRLLASGYHESDAHALIDLNGGGTVQVAKLKDLTVAQILKFLSEGRIAESDARTRLQNKGYAPDDVTDMIDSKLEREPS